MIEVLIVVKDGVINGVYSSHNNIDLEILNMNELEKLPEFKDKEIAFNEVLNTTYKVY